YFTTHYANHIFFFSRIPPQPRSTLFPYTTLFRSHVGINGGEKSRVSLTRVHERSIFPIKKGATFSRGVPVSEIVNSRQIRRIERSEEHTSELQSPYDLVCRLLLEKKKLKITQLY